MATELTVNHVAQIMPGAVANGLEKEWDYLVKTLRDNEINTKNRIAAFLMNVAKESGELYYVEELADGWAYEFRGDLGNIYEGDGPRYKGHGYIQVTGRNNHRKCGEYLGIDAEGNPLLLTQTQYAWASAGWYWTQGSSWGNLNEYADEADWYHTIVGVRGGDDPDRYHFVETAMQVLPDDVVLPGEKKPEDPAPPPPEPEEWPETKIEIIPESGWLWVPANRTWLRGPVNTEFITDKDGWAYARVQPPPPPPPPPPPDGEKWKWPVANVAPNPSSWNYAERNPTRYSWIEGGRADVEDWARWLVDNYNCWVNTYHHHPEEVWLNKAVSREYDSFDVWAYDGRGYPVDPAVGDAIFKKLFNYSGAPYIDWIIWRATMYGAWNNWAGEPFGSDDFSWHYDHIHITYK